VTLSVTLSFDARSSMPCKLVQRRNPEWWVLGGRTPALQTGIGLYAISPSTKACMHLSIPILLGEWKEGEGL
jgi:hypothetical protein